VKWEATVKGRSTAQLGKFNRYDHPAFNEEEMFGFQYSVSSPQCEPAISNNYAATEDVNEHQWWRSLHNSNGQPAQDEEDWSQARQPASMRPMDSIPMLLPEACRKKFVPPAPKSKKLQ
jgi:hypothetical protein